MKKIFIILLSVVFILSCAKRPSVKKRNWTGERSYASNQPVPFQWYGDLEKLLSWRPEADPDRDYNRGTIELQKKFTNKDYFVNKNAKNLGEVSIVSPWWPSENQPSYVSQGSEYFEVQTYTWWQYNDIYIMFNNWHTLPSVEMIDAAHRNGVKVYSLIMDPEPEDVELLVKQEKGVFTGVDKLIEIAEYYKFDGWFLNFERNGNQLLSEKLRDFLVAFNEKGKEKNIRIMMYDSWIENGKVEYQNELNKENLWFWEYKGKEAANEFFVNYWYDDAELEETAKLAEKVKRNPYEIHFGFETWRNYWNRGRDLADSYKVEDVPHRFSIGLFQMNGMIDISKNYKDYYKLGEEFYSGRNYDPSNTSSDKRWKGVAHYYPAKSVINKLPFFTNFCTGNGKFFAVKGKRLKTTGWNNRAVQDILPTWRWIVKSKGEKLVPELDFTDAYYGGSSLKISGNLTDDNFIKLFMTKLEIEENSKLKLILKNNKAESDSRLKVALSFTDKPDEWVYLDAGKLAFADWNSKSINLKEYAGKRIGAVGLMIEGKVKDPSYQILIGQLGITNEETELPKAPFNLRVESKAEDKTDAASIRLKWDKPESEIHSYNIYRRKINGTLQFLGSSTTNAYFVAKCEREGIENESVIIVESVNKEFEFSSKTDSVSFKWETTGVPEKCDKANPVSNITNVEPALILSWGKSKGAVGYEVRFGRNKDSLTVVSKTDKTEFAVDNLEHKTRYFWQVNPYNSFGKEEGEIWEFTTASINSLKRIAFDEIEELQVKGENEFGEEVKENLFDNNPSKKWLDFNSKSWIKISFSESSPKQITGYTLFSANDSPTRDPGEWSFSGSDDGIKWEVIDSRKGVVFNKRNAPKEFYFVNKKKFAHYKFEIKARSGNIVQVGELILKESR